MKIFIKVRPSSKEARVKKIDDTNFVVSVKEPAKDGKANQALIKALAEYFGVSRQNIKILVGQKSRQKIISINR